jgi:hypothetical protein
MNPPHEMQIAQSMQNAVTDGSDFVFLQRLLVHFDDVGGGSDAVLHNQPSGVLVQIAALVFDGVRVVELAEEADFLQDVLPFLQALLAQVRHFLDGDDLAREITARIVDRTERTVTDFAQIIENLVRIVFVEELGDFRVLETSRTRCWRHFCSLLDYIFLKFYLFRVFRLGIVMNYSPL